MSSTLLLVCSTCRNEIDAYIDAVHRAGMRVACISTPSILSENADYPLSTPQLSVEEAVATLEDWGGEVNGVLGVGLYGGVIAAHLAMHLGFDGHTPGGVGITANRERLLSRLERAFIPLPRFETFDVGDLTGEALGELSYPRILQPVIRKRVDQKVWLRDAKAAARIVEDSTVLDRIVGSSPTVLLESAPRESETLVLTGLTHQGQFYHLAFLDRLGPMEGREGEDIMFVAPSEKTTDVLEKACRYTASACSTIGLDDGPVQALFRVVGGDVQLLDVAGHPLPASVARCFRFSRGMTLEEVHVRHALRMEVDLTVSPDVGATMWGVSQAKGQFHELTGVREALNVLDVEDVGTFLYPGQDILPIHQGGRASHWISARGGDRQKVLEALGSASEKVRLAVE